MKGQTLFKICKFIADKKPDKPEYQIVEKNGLFYLPNEKFTGGFNSNGERSGLWTIRRDLHQTNLPPTQEGHYKNDERTGKWKEFNNRGFIEREGPYENGKKNGVWYEYDYGPTNNEPTQKINGVDYGRLKQYGPYVDGKKHGEWIGLFFGVVDKRNIKYVYPYVNGVIEGHYFAYVNDDRNRKIEEGEYVESKRQGIFKRYDFDTGKLSSLTNYKNNYMEGEYVRFHPNGQIAAKGNHIRDKENGEWTYYYPNGNVKVKLNLHNGKEIEDPTFYNEDGSFHGTRIANSRTWRVIADTE